MKQALSHGNKRTEWQEMKLGSQENAHCADIAGRL